MDGLDLDAEFAAFQAEVQSIEKKTENEAAEQPPAKKFKASAGNVTTNQIIKPPTKVVAAVGKPTYNPVYVQRLTGVPVTAPATTSAAPSRARPTTTTSASLPAESYAPSSASQLAPAAAAAAASQKKQQTTVASANGAAKPKKFLRSAAGEVWEDKTLEEWPDNDWRLFVGDLGNEVTDTMLGHCFIEYKSYQKARVVRDKSTTKSKGYGFVSFLDPFEMMKALREKNGKYCGTRPMKISRSQPKKRDLKEVRKQQKRQKRQEKKLAKRKAF